VTGRVKGRFRPHHDLLMVVGEAILKEQFMEYFNMGDMESKPEIELLTSTEEKTTDEIKEQLNDVINKFMEYYEYCKVDIKKIYKINSCVLLITKLC
jgi:hypothetical protein